MIDPIFLSIAGFTICIKFKKSELPISNEQFFKKLLTRQYKGFLVPEPPRVDYWIEIVGKKSFEVFFKTDLQKGYILFVQKASKNQTTTFYHISSIHFQMILRSICQTLFAKHKGMILHASSCLINGKAYLFMGSSGAGKSTSAKIFSRKFTQLADDMVIFKKEGSSFYLYQTPFFEKNTIRAKKPTKFPLGKIFFIKKASSHKIEPIKNKDQILKKLIAQLFSEYRDSSAQMKSLMNFLNSFNEFYYLYFSLRKSGELIKLVKNL